MKIAYKISFGFILGIIFTISVICQTDEKDFDAKIPKPINYEYILGERLAFYLVKDCSVSFGIINKSDNSKITFRITERLIVNKSDKFIEGQIELPTQNQIIRILIVGRIQFGHLWILQKGLK